VSDNQRRGRLLTQAQRIVVKVGSGVLTGERFERINEEVMASIARQTATLIRSGRKVALVSSGSVALGARLLALPRHGLSIPQRQASAALGQGNLIALWSEHFAAEGFKVGQILLTHDDLKNRRRFLNSRNTLNTLLDMNIIPIINENDTVAVHEIKFGDNDALAARVTNLMEADLLAILSDVDGLYSADPRLDERAKKIDAVPEVNDAILAIAGDASSATGLGGMASKVRAAREAARFGAATILMKGAEEGSRANVMAGGEGGTFFSPHHDPLSSKKHWIEVILRPAGTITIDDGAVVALTQKGKSLLGLGVTAMEGVFESGEAVTVLGPDGAPIAKGLSNYHSHELEKIRGKHSNEIERILGYKVYDEIIHRDDMVLLRR